MATSHTFCRICEAACGLKVSASQGPGQPVRLRPDREHPVSQGYVCAKGTRFGELAGHPDRLLHPYVRDAAGRLNRTRWSTAIERAGDGLRRVVETHGPHAVALYYGNPLAFNTMGTLAANLFTEALGSRNVYGAGSQDCNNKFAGAEILHGSPVIHPIPDIGACDMALFFGTNPAVSQSSFVHLEGGAKVLDAAKARGAELVFVDVRSTESSQRWGNAIVVRPGSDVWLILALLNILATDAHTSSPLQLGLDELLEVAATVTPAKAAKLTGLSPKSIRALAERIGSTPKVAMHMSVGVNMGPFGTLAYVALQALMFVTGNLDTRGGNTFHPMAARFADFAARIGLGKRRARSRIGGFAQRLNTLPGAILADEILTEGPDKIRALICIAGDPVRSIPGSRRLNEALGELELIVSIDLFENRTAQAADILLPATSWLERWDLAIPGLALQHGNLVQYSDAVIDAPGECRAESRILADLASAMGSPILGSSLANAAIGRLPNKRLPKPLKRLAGIGSYGLKTPAGDSGPYLGVGPRTRGHRMRFWHSDLAGTPARLAAWEKAALKKAANSDTQLLLVGRRRKIGHNSWVHGGVREVRRGDDKAWMHPSDAAHRKITDGDQVSVTTDIGSVSISVRLLDTVQPGTIVVPHGLPDLNINAVIPSGVAMTEPTSGQHRMTGVAVTVRGAGHC